MISGIGETIGAATIGEIGDIERFDTPGKLVAFAGLDASPFTSPESFQGPMGGYPNGAHRISAGRSGWLLPEPPFAIRFCPNITRASKSGENII